MNVVKYRNWFFAFSLALIIPGIIALSLWGLRLGIDFAGGTLWEIKFTNPPANAQQIQAYEVQNVLTTNGAEVSSAANTSPTSTLVRMKVADEEKINELKTKLTESFGPIQDARLETVGPVVSKELTQKAALSVGVSILAIMLYVTWAFRKVPKPTSSIAFGICTIIALVHDVIVVVGIFAILGHFFHIEVDSLFITALLTVLGFSVHDTIVVFDRVRENLRKYDGYSLEQIVNHSILQTFARSMNTSLTVIFVLLAMLLFGGGSIRSFVLALLIGIVSGTYSSIFNAAPMLVVLQKVKIGKRKS